MGWLPPSCVPYHYFENNSSPRGRGKQDQSPRTHPTPRLIPAWAEKTAAAPGPESQPRAHPRVGGENGISRGGLTLLGGSSPRGRGKPLIAVAENHSSRLIPARAGKQNPSSGAHHLRGLIPARAGKTTRLRRCPTKRSAHPRAGGENVALAEGVGPAMGSSPRGRGKPRTHGAHARADGLIPARAGKTAGTGGRSPSGASHPRAGGENYREAGTQLLDAGSSPRGRGKRAPTKPPPRPTRLIPARAGKTHRGPRRGHCGKAHPRAGGENLTVHFSAANVCGSSPRGRGKHHPPIPGGHTVRLIPARAGKTAIARPLSSHMRAHPRAGGENARPTALGPSRSGSSPRGRGKPDLRGDRLHH